MRLPRDQPAGCPVTLLVLLVVLCAVSRQRRKPRRCSRDASSTNPAPLSRALRSACATTRPASPLSVLTDSQGRYHIAAIPAGRYTVTAEAPGFRTEVIEALDVDVGRTIVRNFVLVVGEQSETVVVRAEVPLVDRASATVGHVSRARRCNRFR